jgi:hypothetical protein
MQCRCWCIWCRFGKKKVSILRADNGIQITGFYVICIPLSVLFPAFAFHGIACCVAHLSFCMFYSFYQNEILNHKGTKVHEDISCVTLCFCGSKKVDRKFRTLKCATQLELNCCYGGGNKNKYAIIVFPLFLN